MSNNRNLTLSIVTFIRTTLDNTGFTGVTIVDQFPDDNLIVVPADYDSSIQGQVVLPALALYEQNQIDGSRLGVGESSMWSYADYTIFLYALSKGQEIDIRTMLREYLNDRTTPFYVYDATTGYSIGATSSTTNGTVEFDNVRARPVRTISPNVALENSGQISFRAIWVRESV